jgi:hypothetical protein
MKHTMTTQEADALLATMTDADFPTVTPEQDITDDMREEIIATGRRLAGRPSLTAPGEHSPRLNFRVPQPVKDRLTQVAHDQNRLESEVARDALAEYLGLATV